MTPRLLRANSSLVEWAISLALPLVEVASLVAAARYNHERFDAPEFALSIITFLLAFPGRIRFGMSFTGVALRELGAWVLKVALLIMMMVATGTEDQFDRETLFTWAMWTPVLLIAGHELLRVFLPTIGSLKGFRSAVIVGATATGQRLAELIGDQSYLGIRLMGFFDDRTDDRLTIPAGQTLLGRLEKVADYARAERVEAIIVTLPMYQSPRILALLDSLRDTTASIYFAPDVFTFDLIQGRTSDIAGVPIVAVCETPFYGMAAVSKRTLDLVGASVALILLSPLMIAVALAVRLTSKGPAFFRQRRYGLDGREITVYKFRSMTVMEDAENVPQASRNDPRITPLGAFLRRTSIDELPQLINVLQGRMSLVGPRPHAVSHNETYRGMIKGYMIRHKVKPGITGWAQVNGARGETETLDKMEKRIDYDLEYLRNWTLRFDIFILVRTLFVAFRQEEAY